MQKFLIITLALLATVALLGSPFQATTQDPEAEARAYEALQAALEDEWAIDNHTHIVYGADYDEELFGYMPLAMQHAVPEQLLSKTDWDLNVVIGGHLSPFLTIQPLLA